MRSRFEHKSFFASALLTALILSGCATHEIRDPANDDEVVQMMIQSKLDEQKVNAQDKTVLVKQDLNTATLKDRSEHEELINLENEISNQAGTVTVDEREPATSKEAPASKPVPHAKASVQNHYVPLNLSQEELNQQLFDADSVIVQKGDSLSGIAAAHLGNVKDWNKIWALNPNLHNPDSLEVGDKLYLPRNDGGRKIASVSAPSDKKPEVKVEKPVAKSIKASVEKPVTTKTTKPKEVKPAIEAKAEVKKDTQSPPNFQTEPAPTPPAQNDEPVPPTKEELNVIEGAFLPANTWNSEGHSVAELQKEHLDILHFATLKDKPAGDVIGRKVASVDEANIAEENHKTETLPKGLTNVVSYVGIFLLLAVLGGFFFSKPQKNS